jgi:hypothetical protein
LDSGTNGNLATSELVKKLGLRVVRRQGGKLGVQTAQVGQKMVIEGVVDAGGIVGKMNVTADADCNLLSVGKLQDQGIRVTFMEKGAGGQCVLEKGNRLLKTVARDERTRLHDIDVRELQEIDFGQEIWALAARKDRLPVEASPRARRSKLELITLRDRVFRLHKSLGHAHFRAMASAIRDGAITGTELTYQDVMLVAKHVDCTACALAKWSVPENTSSLMVTPTEPFHTISVDGLGPYTPVAVGGYTRAILATCGATLFQMGKLIKKYNGRELVSFLNDIVALAKSKKFVVKVVRYDAGSVENSEEVKHFLRLHQMEGRAALPEHQNQNPVERSVRTIKETVAANMIDQKTLGAAYWGLCFIMAVKQRNMVPNVLCPDSSPSIEVLGQSVDVALSGTHFFGEVVVVPKQGYRSGKKMAIGETRNELAHIVGYGKNYNGGWLVQRLAKPLSRPVERKNPQSLIGLPDKELTEVIGKDWLPVTRADGTIEIRSRAPIAPVMGALQWHTVDPEVIPWTSFRTSVIMIGIRVV